MSAEKPAVAEKPLDQLNAKLPDILAKAGHTEMWGVELKGADHVPTQVVLQKFLRANSNDVAAAEKQLLAALEWRKELQPLALVHASYDKAKFADLGFVTLHSNGDAETVVTWNIYGAVKDNKATFGNVKEFIRWRAALMELSVQKLNLNAVTKLIPEGGEDPYQMYQVHDYQSVAFFRMDPAVKAASTETIKTFSTAYPELLAHKYFVNVPAIMGWMYAAMKLFLAPATLKKFHPMSSGLSLAAELPSIAESLPKEYGGKGPSVKEGLAVKLVDAAELEKQTEAPAAAPAAVTKPVEETLVAKPAEETKAVEPVEPVTVPQEVTESKPVTEEKPLEASEVKPETEAKPEAEIITGADVAADVSEPAVKQTEQKVVA